MSDEARGDQTKRETKRKSGFKAKWDGAEWAGRLPESKLRSTTQPPNGGEAHATYGPARSAAHQPAEARVAGEHAGRSLRSDRPPECAKEPRVPERRWGPRDFGRVKRGVFRGRPMANSSKFVRPRKTAPAARSFRTTVES